MFSEKAWQAIKPIYQDILAHSFIQELKDGNLRRDRFIYYMQQDALYLIDFARALALIAGRVQEPKMMEHYIRFAEGALVAERQLHEYYFEHYAVVADTVQSVACSGYTHFLLSTAMIGGVAEAMAAVLPCFWIYAEVGKYVYQESCAENPYQPWIDMYASEAFTQTVRRAITLTNAAYESAGEEVCLAMTAAFVESAKWEFLFWDDAYHGGEQLFTEPWLRAMPSVARSRA